LAVIEPDESNRDAYLNAYAEWKEELNKVITK
jgi:xylulokinase